MSVISTYVEAKKLKRNKKLKLPGFHNQTMCNQKNLNFPSKSISRLFCSLQNTDERIQLLPFISSLMSHNILAPSTVEHRGIPQQSKYNIHC